MNLIYAHEPHSITPEPSIFLAGPSPRKKEHHDWRKDAIKILEKLHFSGTVYIPLPRFGDWTDHYDDQIEWELKGLHRSSHVAFWIPRDLIDLPGFTTNVEFGYMYGIAPTKISLGYPEGAPKMRYIAYLATKKNVSIFHDMESLLKYSIDAAMMEVKVQEIKREGEIISKRLRNV